VLTLPMAPTRSLDAYKINTGTGEDGDPAMVSTSPAVLAADLNAGLKRLKMAAMRRLAPELLVTAKTQRWSPEEFLRTLVEAEIAARDASNAATRRRQAGFPVTKILDDYDLTASSVQQARSR
jgi:DNA replication protein DnaC